MTERNVFLDAVCKMKDEINPGVDELLEGILTMLKAYIEVIEERFGPDKKEELKKLIVDLVKGI